VACGGDNKDLLLARSLVVRVASSSHPSPLLTQPFPQEWQATPTPTWLTRRGLGTHAEKLTSWTAPFWMVELWGKELYYIHVFKKNVPETLGMFVCFSILCSHQ
jgi:hypothetical protein